MELHIFGNKRTPDSCLGVESTLYGMEYDASGASYKIIDIYHIRTIWKNWMHAEIKINWPCNVEDEREKE